MTQFVRWRFVVDLNGNRMDEAQTSFQTPIRRPDVLARPEMQGCIRCLMKGGLSYWTPFLDGGIPWFSIPKFITQTTIYDVGRPRLELIIVGTDFWWDLGDFPVV
jgi:hypothetical protein